MKTLNELAKNLGLKVTNGKIKGEYKNYIVKIKKK